jgi:Bacterial SH3 domain
MIFMSVSSFFQFVFGFILGISLVAGSAVGLGYMLLTRMSVTPPKPVFSEETNPPKQDSQETAAVQKTQQNESPTKTIPPEEEELLPSGAYRAVVTWSQGLSMRSEPNSEADRVGSVLVNQKIIVLQESEDKKWQKIRLPKSDLSQGVFSNREGWVRAGNIKKVR